jgi:beta-aspartyl-peptidase (threonine type)
MRRPLLALVACAALWLSACASVMAPPTEAVLRHADDVAQMNAVLQASADAWNRGDLTGHLAIYDGSVRTMARSGPRPGVAAIEASFRSTYFSGDKPRQDLRMERVEIRPLSADAALMTGRFVLSGGGQAEQSGWFTLVWLRTPTGWKVVHDHTS